MPTRALTALLATSALGLVLAGTARAEDSVTIEAYGQQMFGDGAGLGLGARVQPGSAFIAAEGRSIFGGHWIGRGTIGLDLFGGSEVIDLTGGLFLGTTGSWAPVGLSTVDPTAGLELGIGVNAGPVRARYRHANGFTGPLEEHLTENEWRLGFELGRLQFFGQYLRFNPGEEQAVGGFGAGASMTF